MTGSAPLVLYEERQQFRQIWLWTIIFLVSLAALGVSLGSGAADSGSVARDCGLLVVVAVILLTVGLLYLTSLRVTVDAQQVLVRFRPWPLGRRRIALSDIASCEPRTYHPIREYGGWGIRWSPFGSGWAYNVSGNRGVQLVLRDGKRILIGSQQADALADAINRARVG